MPGFDCRVALSLPLVLLVPQSPHSLTHTNSQLPLKLEFHCNPPPPGPEICPPQLLTPYIY